MERLAAMIAAVAFRLRLDHPVVRSLALKEFSWSMSK
jgi:hypothetical protein